jgi:hypothetical protein
MANRQQRLVPRDRLRGHVILERRDGVRVPGDLLQAAGLELCRSTCQNAAVLTKVLDSPGQE